MNLEFSIHATERMLERGITEDEVHAAVDEPEYTFPASVDPNIRNYVGGDIVVVVGSGGRVVTVHRRSDRTTTNVDSRPLNTFRTRHYE
jgi:hypothetical protein